MSRLSDDEKRVFTDQISLLKNENERLTDRIEELEAAVAGMRDKWTPPDEVAKLEVEIEAYKNREKGMEICEGCSEWYEIERMNLTDDGVWLCPRDWDALLTADAPSETPLSDVPITP